METINLYQNSLHYSPAKVFNNVISLTKKEKAPYVTTNQINNSKNNLFL